MNSYLNIWSQWGNVGQCVYENLDGVLSSKSCHTLGHRVSLQFCLFLPAHIVHFVLLVCVSCQTNLSSLILIMPCPLRPSSLTLSPSLLHVFMFSSRYCLRLAPSPLHRLSPLSLSLKRCQLWDSLSVYFWFRLDILKCYGFLLFLAIGFKGTDSSMVPNPFNTCWLPVRSSAELFSTEIQVFIFHFILVYDWNIVTPSVVTI